MDEDLTTATAARLAELFPDLGLLSAEDIVSWREQHHAFPDAATLSETLGLDKTTAAQIAAASTPELARPSAPPARISLTAATRASLPSSPGSVPAPRVSIPASRASLPAPVRISAAPGASAPPRPIVETSGGASVPVPSTAPRLSLPAPVRASIPVAIRLSSAPGASAPPRPVEIVDRTSSREVSGPPAPSLRAGPTPETTGIIAAGSPAAEAVTSTTDVETQPSLEVSDLPIPQPAPPDDPVSTVAADGPSAGDSASLQGDAAAAKDPPVPTTSKRSLVQRVLPAVLVAIVAAIGGLGAGLFQTHREHQRAVAPIASMAAEVKTLEAGQSDIHKELDQAKAAIAETKAKVDEHAAAIEETAKTVKKVADDQKKVADDQKLAERERAALGERVAKVEKKANDNSVSLTEALKMIDAVQARQQARSTP